MQEKNNHTNITKHRKQVFGPYSSGTRYFQIVAVKKNLQYEVRERETERVPGTSYLFTEEIFLGVNATVINYNFDSVTSCNNVAFVFKVQNNHSC